MADFDLCTVVCCGNARSPGTHGDQETQVKRERYLLKGPLERTRTVTSLDRISSNYNDRLLAGAVGFVLWCWPAGASSLLVLRLTMGAWSGLAAWPCSQRSCSAGPAWLGTFLPQSQVAESTMTDVAIPSDPQLTIIIHQCGAKTGSSSSIAAADPPMPFTSSRPAG